MPESPVAPSGPRRPPPRRRAVRLATGRIRDLDLGTHALALAAQQMLCTVPLVVALAAVLQQERDKGIAYATVRFFDLHGEAASAVRELLGRNTSAMGLPALVLSLVTAVVFGTGIASTHQRAFELMWGLRHVTGSRSYLRQLVWTSALGAFAVAMLAATRIGIWFDTVGPGFGTWAAGTARGLIIAGFYLWSQRWLLGARVGWRALFPGAIGVGVLTSGLIAVTRVLVDGQVSWQLHAYGLVGVAFVLATWLMLLSVLIFAGVLVGAMLDEHRRRRVETSRDQ